MDNVCLAWRDFADEIKFKIIVEMISESVVYDLPLGRAIKWAGIEVQLKLLAYMDIGLAANDYMIIKATNYIIDAVGYDYVTEYYFTYIHNFRKLTFSTVGKAITHGLSSDSNIFEWVKNIYKAEGRHLIFVFHMCSGCRLCEISDQVYSAIDALNKAGRLGQLKAEILKSMPDVLDDQFNVEYGMILPLKLCGLYEREIKKRLEDLCNFSNLQFSFGNLTNPAIFEPSGGSGKLLYPNCDHNIS